MNSKLIAFAFFGCVILLAIGIFFVQKERPVVTNKEPVDVKICNGIGTDDLKVICLAFFTNDPSRCKDAGSFDTYCYESTFGLMKNFSESLCESFSDYTPRTACYLKLAMIEKDFSLCEKSSGRYQQCSWEVAKLTKNSSLCDNLETQFEKLECLAEVTGDDSYCKQITSDLERGTCFIKLGKNADLKRCGEDVPIENPSFTYTQLCISNVALANKDISMCNLLENKEGKWRCLASLSKSIDICNNGESQFWEDFCKVEYIKANFEKI